MNNKYQLSCNNVEQIILDEGKYETSFKTLDSLIAFVNFHGRAIKKYIDTKKTLIIILISGKIHASHKSISYLYEATSKQSDI